MSTPVLTQTLLFDSHTEVDPQIVTRSQILQVYADKLGTNSFFNLTNNQGTLLDGTLTLQEPIEVTATSNEKWNLSLMPNSIISYSQPKLKLIVMPGQKVQVRNTNEKSPMTVYLILKANNVSHHLPKVSIPSFAVHTINA